MTPFRALFGIEKSQIKKTAIILPLLNKDILTGLGVKKFIRGRLYGIYNTPRFTVIHTGISHALVGDAVLYLKDSPCENIIFFGSCGLVDTLPHLKLGGLVTPEKCYSLESFTEMLTSDKKDWALTSPDEELLKTFLYKATSYDVKKVICASVGSLKLEENYIQTFKKKNIEVLDMECSAFFSASKNINKPSIALFYITDTVKVNPFYRTFLPEEETLLTNAAKKAADLLCEFIKQNQTV